jgi:asparagine synthase (glutamine-hydrolysing)
MGGISLIYNADGRPLDRAVFDRMHGSIAHRGIDGTSEWFGESIALGYQAFHTTAEATIENQPLHDAARRLVLVMDGRIDNRHELADALRSRGQYPRSDTDAELMLCAYQSWGTSAPRHVVGDFAVVIWDAAQRTLFCARDHVGIKPLFYCYDGHTFLCGSELQQLLAAPFVAHAVDEEVAGLFLNGVVTDPDRTIYRNIRRLPPAYWLTLSGAKLSTRCYFDIDPSHRIRYRDDLEYADHFRELFAEAVRCRLRTPNKLAAVQLSGGLDSTSVAGMARALLADGSAGDTSVETFSLIFPDMRCDERRWISQSTAMFGLPASLIPAKVMDARWLAEAVRRYQDFGDVPNGAMWPPLWAAERTRGFRVALTGAGSDDYMTGSPYVPADLLLQFKWRRLYEYMGSAEQRAWQRAESLNTLTFLLRFMTWPLLPPGLQLAIKRMFGRKLYAEFIRPEFARRIRMAAGIRWKPRFPHRMSFADRAVYEWYRSGALASAMEYQDRCVTRAGLEERHPFHDRRLVEFVFALPAEQRCQNGLIKFVLRNAMSGLIPEDIRTRPDKAGYGDIFLAALQKVRCEIPKLTALEEAGWIDSAAFDRAFNQVFEPCDDDPPGIWPVWSTLAMEFWYRLVVLRDEKFLAEKALDSEFMASSTYQ